MIKTTINALYTNLQSNNYFDLFSQNKEPSLAPLVQKTLEPKSNESQAYWITERAALTLAATTLAAAAAAAYVFSKTIASVASAVACAGVTLLPIALMGTAGYVAWQAYNTIDYDNPRELAQCKEEAKSLPLCEIFKKHPNGRAGGNKIITQELFTQKYIEESSKLNTVPHLENYRYSIRGTNGFFNFPSSLEDKERNQKRLKEACSSLTFDEVVTLHGGLNNVITWDLLSPDQIKGNEASFKEMSNLLRSH